MHPSDIPVDNPVFIPPECTGLIIQYLWNDLPTLHRLLLCNREFFSLVVPVLYRDPFRLIDSHHVWNRFSRTKRTAKLMQVLHTCAVTMPSQLDQDSVTALETRSKSFPPLSETSSAPAPPLPPVNRGPLPRISFESDIKPLPTPLTVDYLFYYTHQHQIPRAFAAFPILDPRIVVGSPRPANQQLLVKVSTNLSLTLFGHYPSRIQVLSMTPSQLAQVWFNGNSSISSGTCRPNSNVQALKMLRRLELDFGPSISPISTWNSTAHKAADNEGDAATGEIVDVADILQTLLLFIQEHQKIFPACPEDLMTDRASRNGWGGEHRELGTSVRRYRRNRDVAGSLLQEIAIRGSNQTWTPTVLLSNIAPLKIIDLSAWNSNVPDLERIPSSRLKSLKINNARHRDFVEVPVMYLQNHCKQLQEIWMSALTADTFKWAIDSERPIGPFVPEAKLRRRRGIQNSNISSNVGTAVAAEDVAEIAGDLAGTNIGHIGYNQEPLTSVQQQLQQRLSQQDPGRSVDAPQIPPLQKVRLSGTPNELIPSLEDAADAFRDILVELVGNEVGFTRRDEYPRISIGWPLPQLTRLELSGRFVFLFNLKSLRFTPNLRVVKLHIESNIMPQSSGERDREYEGPDFAVFTGMRLEELELRGSWGIDDTTLEVLTGGLSLDSNEEQQHNQQICKLKETLLSFVIPESHMPKKAGLERFVREMRRLQVINLGTKYRYLAESLRKEAGPRLYVDIDGVEA
ncbi:hypothetical protein BGX27_008718 [Mortierella sp. AM989]|nr:hypothetical protein BGX27_008718 [Mortierella sp. AM989]